MGYKEGTGRTHSMFIGPALKVKPAVSATRERGLLTGGLYTHSALTQASLSALTRASLGLGGLDRPEDVVRDHELGTVVGGEGLVRVGIKVRVRAKARVRSGWARVSGLMNG